MTNSMTDVLQAHRSLYDAVESADVDLMANVGYIQFFLTDIDVMAFPPGAEDPHTAVITCTENILSGEGLSSDASFAGGTAIATSMLVRDPSTSSGHASPAIDMTSDLSQADEEES